MLKILTLIALLPLLIAPYKSPNFLPNRNTIIQFFEWKWKDIADECENFLQHTGYGGVQVSPPNENVIIKNRPWFERYQPVSYVLETRSGNENAFKDMTKRCNAAGIRVYVDTIINHMAAYQGTGTAGNVANSTNMYFPGVPYGPNDFHSKCGIDDFDNKETSRNCYLFDLLDLDQSKDYVREKILEFMNHLIDLGVAGFRVDAAAHIWPNDLKYIYSHLKDLNVEYGFPSGSRPFIYQEASSMDREYAQLGCMIEFQYSRELSNAFRGRNKLKWLKTWGTKWNLINGLDAVAFIDNHDSQRDLKSLSYKEAKQYKMATAFMLAHPYGTTKILSSYDFTNKNQGPPSDVNENIISPGFNKDNTCTNGWICEHRWREIYNMIEFRNVVDGTEINNWWSNEDQQIAFCRGNKGFVVFTNWGDISHKLQTCLPPGLYCDIISGEQKNGTCTGKSVQVQNDGKAYIYLGAMEFNGVMAIHVNSKLR